MSGFTFDVEQRFSGAPVCVGGAVTKPEPVRYQCAPAGMSQRRFAGRHVLTPQIDLKAYTVRAVVDWVKLAVEISRTTQALTVSQVLAAQVGPTEVTGTDGCMRRTGASFNVTIQDATPPKLLLALRAIHQEFGLIAKPTILGIEVSIDWCANDGSDQARWRMVSVLQRHFMPKAAVWTSERDQPRFTFEDKGWTRTTKLYDPPKRLPISASPTGAPRLGRPTSPLTGHSAPFLDSTLYWGAREADVMFRVQNKISDKRHPTTGPRVMLNGKKSRARIEATLRREELSLNGLREVGDLWSFRFETLRDRYFDFWLPTVESEQIERETKIGIFSGSGIYGLEIRDFETERREFGAPPNPHLAYSMLGERASQALRRLSTRWSH